MQVSVCLGIDCDVKFFFFLVNFGKNREDLVVISAAR